MEKHICECGQTVGFNATRHYASLWHNNYKRFYELLADKSLTFTEIGKMYGVSRERIRQVCSMVADVRGRERQRVRTVQKEQIRYAQLPDFPAVEEAKKRGFELKPYIVRTWFGPSRRCAYINGKLCGFYGSYKRPHTPKGVAIRPPKRNDDLDFVIYSVPYGGYLIIPREHWPHRETCFSLTPSYSKTHAYSHRHDYVSFYNAWDLLKKEHFELPPAFTTSETKDITVHDDGDRFFEVSQELSELMPLHEAPLRFASVTVAERARRYIYSDVHKHSRRKYGVRRRGNVLYITLASPKLGLEVSA